MSASEILEEAVKIPFWKLGEKVESMLKELFLTEDSLAEAKFAGGFVELGPLEWDGPRARQAFWFEYSDEGHTEEP